MKIALIGAGRVATNLAKAFVARDMPIVEVWSRTRASAEALVGQLHELSPQGQCTCKAVWGRVEDVCTDADLYIIAVKDDALATVAQALHSGRESALIVHTAGSMSMSVITDTDHERSGVFYPMQTFSKEREVDFSCVHFFVEAAAPADETLLSEMAFSLTQNEDFVHHSTAALRRRLHLAAVFACNFLNHCCTLSAEILKEDGLDFSVMLPLVDETVAKLHQLPPREAQTGPAIRHDDKVTGLQQAMLAHHPELQKIYTLLTNSIQHYD